MAGVMDVQPVTLEGAHVRLVPMELAHHEALTAIGLDPSLWRHTTIRVRTPGEMRQYVELALAAGAAGTALPFVIEARQTGEVVGTTRYHSIVREHRRLEIGFTWIAVPWQGTAVNSETKFLLLRHAFDVLGCQRVEFKAAVANEPSRRALLRIGATEEGILRQYVFSKHLGPCDVRIFSILSRDWPTFTPPST
jgi:RimJ/RimL family protein N-acetyltransferase